MLSSLLKSFANTDVLLLTKSEMSSSPISSWSTKLSRKHTEFKIKEKKKESLKFAIAVFLKLLWASEGWGVELWSRKRFLQSNGYKNYLVVSLTHSSNVPWLYPPSPIATQSCLTRVSVLNQMDVGCWNITSLPPSKIFHSEKLYFWNK